jgi:hypothetical protein
MPARASALTAGVIVREPVAYKRFSPFSAATR